MSDQTIVFRRFCRSARSGNTNWTLPKSVLMYKSVSGIIPKTDFSRVTLLGIKRDYCIKQVAY